jgi:ABC-type antimicrobial peptide transport system permease subunit
MLIYLWVDSEIRMDKFHEKDSRLFQVMEHQQYAEEIMTTWSTPGILAETMAQEFPEIEYAATTTWIGDYTLSVEDHIVQAEGYHVGTDYFNIFSYNMIHGDEDLVLRDKNSIVISEELAIKLYETTDDIIGKSVVLQHDETYLISGVFAGTPRTSSFQFDFVMSFEKYKDNNEWVLNWGNHGPSTYVILKENYNLDALNDKIADFIKTKEEESQITLFLKQYSTQYLYGSFQNGVPSGGRIEYVRLFSIIAVFILVIACINFMNLSTARASRRAKEVGIKKLIISILAVWAILPQFNEITDKRLTIDFNNPTLILWFLGMTLLTGLIAGSYPAMYLSGFKPAAILKGEIKGSWGELLARKGLVVFQFTLSIILIVAVLVVFKQIQFVQNKNLGYNKDNVIYFKTDGQLEENLDTFLDEASNIPGVVMASSVGHDMVGRQNNTSGLNWEGKNPDDNILFENVRVNYDLIETLNIEILDGRSFSREFSTDTTKIIFNEAGIKVMGLEGDPIGQVINLWEEHDLEIIGVAKDFHFQSLHTAVNPLFFVLDTRYNWNVMIRIEGGKEQETLAGLKDFYESYNPGFTFDYQFLDEEYQRQYAAEQRVAKLSQYFAGMAILISCLGLFGLAAFTAERRQKEIGIRKALGSSAASILYLLTSDFTKLVILSSFIALPVSYMLVSTWLERFAFKIELGAWFFIGAGLIALIIAWITVGTQAIKAANVNPAECLRSE